MTPTTPLRGGHRTLSPTQRAAWRRGRRLATARRFRWSDDCRVGNGPRLRSRPGVGSPLLVWSALPPGHRVAVNLARWLERVRQTALNEFRDDAAERRVCLAAILATHTDWTTATYRGGWALLSDRGCVSRSTVRRFLSWARQHDLIAVVSTGRVGALTVPMALAEDPQTGRNDAAVYVLCEPTPPPRPPQPGDPGLVALDPRYASGQLGVDELGRAIHLTPPPLDTAARQLDRAEPAGSLTSAQSKPQLGSQAVDRTDPPNRTCEAGTQSARERKTCPTCNSRAAPLRGEEKTAATRRTKPARGPDSPFRRANNQTEEPLGPGSPGQPAEPCSTCGPWPRRAPAHTRTQRLRLIHRLRATAPSLKRVGSPLLLRHLLRPWLLAGWTVDDVLIALDEHPHTGARPHSPLASAPGSGPGAIHHPPGWLLARMRDWTHPDGTPLPSHAQRTAAATAVRLAADHATRTAATHQAAIAVPPTPEYQAARAALHGRINATAGRHDAERQPSSGHR